MTQHVIVILNRADIPAAQMIFTGLPACDVFLFDPLLADPAFAAGFKNLELFSALGAPAYHTLDRDAHAAAHALEADIDAAQLECGCGISIGGWQHLSLYYLFISIHWYTGLWESMAARLRQRHVHVFINDNPAVYYFNSFVPATLLIAHLRTQGIPFNAYDYGGTGTPAYGVPDFSGEAPESGSDLLLTHLATCFYDVQYFSDEIRAARKRVINLQARLWDVPTPADRQIGLADLEIVRNTLTPVVQGRIASFTHLVHAALDRLLTPHLPLSQYRRRQVDLIVGTYVAQLVTFFELRRFFGDTGTFRILMSEHDAGFHGPLIAFAQTRSLPVVLVPHSKVSGNLEFSYTGISMLTHPMQGQPILDADGRPVQCGSISYPERFSSSSTVGQGLRVVSVLLNALSLNGVPYAPTDVYLNGIRRIVAWCAQNDIVAKFRCKPGYSIIAVLSAHLGMDRGMLTKSAGETMAEHARDCDLCVMYDMPTTAAMHFLANSIPILNPVVTLATTAFLAIVHPDVIATETLDATLQRLDGFKSNPLTLYDFRAAQFQAYLARFRTAHPLRTSL